MTNSLLGLSSPPTLSLSNGLPCFFPTKQPPLLFQPNRLSQLLPWQSGDFVDKSGEVAVHGNGMHSLHRRISFYLPYICIHIYINPPIISYYIFICYGAYSGKWRPETQQLRSYICMALSRYRVKAGDCKYSKLMCFSCILQMLLVASCECDW